MAESPFRHLLAIPPCVFHSTLEAPQCWSQRWPHQVLTCGLTCVPVGAGTPLSTTDSHNPPLEPSPYVDPKSRLLSLGSRLCIPGHTCSQDQGCVCPHTRLQLASLWCVSLQNVLPLPGAVQAPPWGHLSPSS